ncbi:hypothetical protein NN561_012971 [Cricetulus griseus]
MMIAMKGGGEERETSCGYKVQLAPEAVQQSEDTAGLRMENGLSRTSAWDLDKFIEVHLLPNTSFRTEVKAAINTISAFLKERCFQGAAHPVRVSKLVKVRPPQPELTSVGRERTLRTQAAALSGDFEDQLKRRGEFIQEIKKQLYVLQREKLLRVKFEVQSSWWPNPQALSFKLSSFQHQQEVEFDVLPAYDALGQLNYIKPHPQIYADLIRECTSLGKESEFSTSFTELQRNFLKRHPPKLKSLIRLVKHWYQLSKKKLGKPLPPQYALELLTVYAWEHGSGFPEFKISRGFRTVLELVMMHRQLRIYWTVYYDFQYQYVSNYLHNQLRRARPDPEIYGRLINECTYLGLEGEFSICFSELQQNFLKDRPPKLKNLIRLVKHWYQLCKEKLREPLPPEYALELLTVYAWEHGSRRLEFNTAQGFRTVLELVTNYRQLRVYWRVYYDLPDREVSKYLLRQLRKDRPVILDPADPTRNVAGGNPLGWWLLAEEATTWLEYPCVKNCEMSPLRPWPVSPNWDTQEPRATEEKPLGPRMELELNCTPAAELDKFIEDYLLSNSSFHNEVRAIIDIVCTFLKERCFRGADHPVRVSKVVKEPRATEEKPLGPRMELELNCAPAAELDKFIEDFLLSNSSFHNEVRAIIDIVCTFLKERCFRGADPPVRVSKVVKEPRATEEKPLGPRMELELNCAPAAELDKFIEDFLLSNSSFHNEVRAIIDIVCTFLKERCFRGADPPVRVSKVVKEPRATEEKPLGPRMELELNCAPAAELDKFIEDFLLSNSSFHNEVRAIIDIVCTFLKERCFRGADPPVRVSKVVKGGSSGKGKMLLGKWEADLVVFLNNLTCFEDQLRQRGKFIQEIKKQLCALQQEKTFHLKLEVQDSNQPNSQGLSFKLRSPQLLQQEVEFDVLLAYDVLGDVSINQKPEPYIYGRLIIKCTSLGLEGEFNTCFTELQGNFLKDRPPQLKNLIRLVKHWYQLCKEKLREPLPPQYALELLTVYAWERGSGFPEFNTAEGFRTVLELVTNYRQLRIYWTVYYDFQYEYVSNCLHKQLSRAR